MLQITNKDLSTQEATILVVIDPQVAAPESLISGIKTNTKAVLLDPNQDHITQITTLLAQGNYTTLHLISHGSPGCLHLGETKLTTENLSQYNQQLLEWGIREILVYGCNVAAAPELLRQLHYLTGATIAASTKEVGKGNWNLEWQIGEITADSAFTTELQQEYQGVFVEFTETTFAAGTGTDAVAIGDLDGDGNVDLVAANYDSDNISVLLGDGSGGFTETTFGVGNAPNDVAIGDLDGDGNVDDIAVVNYFDSNISVLLGDGSGGFTETTFGGVGFVSKLAVGDFNDDGTDDIAAVNFNNVQVLLSDGSGSFTGPTAFAAGSGPTSVAVGDFNDDNDLDLAVSNQNSADVSIFLGDGSGSFAAPTSVSVGTGEEDLLQATSVEVGDLDNDGEIDDLVVSRRLQGDVAVFLGDNSGGFSTITTFAAGASFSLAIGDVDGDNNADIVTANHLDANVSVLLGDGSGSFATQETFSVGNNPRSVAIGDLDGDGDSRDLATANRDDNNVSVLIECFLTGTHILTEQGEVAVENLQIGDQVQTAEGQTETIKWIGKQTIETHQVKNPLRGYPVLIKAGALGNNLPHQDLYVSPDHAMFIDGLLINAGALVNDISIIKTEPNETFTYYHVELENHALLVAEGTAAESYLPQKENREQYDNFAEYQDLYPNGSNLMLWPMNYPRISSCNKVPRFVNKKLLKIAHQLFAQDIKLRA